MTTRTRNILATIALISAFASNASAESVRWCLEDAVFVEPDGTSLTGYFDYDVTVLNPYARVTEFNIQSETYGEFPGTSYLSPIGYAAVDDRGGVTINGIIFFPDRDSENNTGESHLKLRTLVGEMYLTDLLADESVTEIDLTLTNQSFECLNCIPSRRLASGRLVRAESLSCTAASSPNSVPMMPIWGFLLMASLLGLIGARKLIS